MDLSQFSDSDLLALEAGDITKLSNQGLLLLEKMQSPARSVPPARPTTPPSKERTWGEAITDPLASAAAGLGQVLQMPGQLTRLVSGAQAPGGLEDLGKGVEEYWAARKSKGLQAREQARAQAIAKAEEGGGVVAPFLTAIGETITDPALLSSFLAEQVPQLVVGGGVGKGVQVGVRATLASAAKKGAEAGMREGVAASVAYNALAQGVDIGADTYEATKDQLTKQGMDPELAHARALTAARQAAYKSGLLSMGLQAVPGATAVERALLGGKSGLGAVKGAVAGALGEGASEALEEGGGRYFQNVAMQGQGLDVPTLQGVGSSAGLGAVGGLGMGSVAGGISGIRTPEQKERELMGEQFPADLAYRMREEQKLREAEEQQRKEAAAPAAPQTEKEQRIATYADELLGAGVVATQDEANKLATAKVEEELADEAQAEAQAKEGAKPPVPPVEKEATDVVLGQGAGPEAGGPAAGARVPVPQQPPGDGAPEVVEGGGLEPAGEVAGRPAETEERKPAALTEQQINQARIVLDMYRAGQLGSAARGVTNYLRNVVKILGLNPKLPPMTNEQRDTPFQWDQLADMIQKKLDEIDAEQQGAEAPATKAQPVAEEVLKTEPAEPAVEPAAEYTGWTGWPTSWVQWPTSEDRNVSPESIVFTQDTGFTTKEKADKLLERYGEKEKKKRAVRKAKATIGQREGMVLPRAEEQKEQQQEIEDLTKAAERFKDPTLSLDKEAYQDLVNYLEYASQDHVGSGETARRTPLARHAEYLLNEAKVPLANRMKARAILESASKAEKRNLGRRTMKVETVSEAAAKEEARLKKQAEKNRKAAEERAKKAEQRQKTGKLTEAELEAKKTQEELKKDAAQPRKFELPEDVAKYFKTPEQAEDLLDIYRQDAKLDAKLIPEEDHTALKQLMEAGKFDEAFQEIFNILLRAKAQKLASINRGAYERVLKSYMGAKSETQRRALEAAIDAAGNEIALLSHKPVGAELPGVVVGKILDNDLKGALEALSRRGSTPLIRGIAKKLAQAVRDTDIVVVPIKEPGVPGKYYPRNDFIVIDPLAMHEHTLLHETSHAVLDRLIADGKHALVKELQFIFKKVKNNLGDAYGAESIYEFSAESLGNPEFQDLLRSMPEPKGALRTMWDHLVDAFRRALGLTGRTSKTAMDKIDDVLSKLLEVDSSSVAHVIPPYGEYANVELALEGDAEALKKGAKRLSANPNDFNAWGDIFGQGRSAGERMGALKLWITTSPYTNFRRAALTVATPHHLSQMFGDAIPSIKDTTDAMINMDGRTAELMKESAVLADRWADFMRKHPEGNRALSEIIHASTIAGIDPSTEAGRAKSPILAEAWKDLGKYDGAHKLYTDLRDFYKNRFNMNQTLLLQRVEQAFGKMPDTANMTPEVAAKAMEAFADNKKRVMAGIRSMFEKSTLKEPYFPLARFGQYWIKIGSGKDMIFDMSDTKYEHERKIQEYLREGYKASDMQTEWKLNKQRSFMESSSTFLKDIMQAVDKNEANKETTEQLKDSIYQAYLDTLPEISMRRHFIRRKNTAGYSPDAYRAFVKSAYHTSTQLARMEYGPKALNSITSARAAMTSIVKEAAEKDIPPPFQPDVMDEVIKEMQSRVSAAMKRTDTDNPLEQIANSLTNISFYYYLSSASSALNQLFSVPVNAYPQLISEFPKSGIAGVTNTLSAMTKNVLVNKMSIRNGQITYPSYDTRIPKFQAIYDKATQELVKAREKYIAQELSSEDYEKLNHAAVLETLAGEVAPSQRADFDRRRAYEEALSRNVFDATITSDFQKGLRTPSASVAGRSKILTLADSLSAGLFHSTEKASREITYMTAYELGRKEGMSHREAVDKAIDVSFKALGNYGTSNRPGILNQPVVRVVAQFKRYPIEMAFYLGKNMVEMVGGLKAYANNPDLSPEERAQAKALAKAASVRLLGTLGMTSVLAGSMGLPFPLVFITQRVAMMMGTLGDDDEDRLMRETPDLWFRTWMREKFTSRAIADAIMYGPVSVGMNINLHDRLKLDDMFLRDTAIKQAKDTQGEAQQWFIEMLGPSVGMFMNGAKAFDFLKEGKFGRAAEAVLPAGLRNLAVAYRYQTEGVKTAGGYQVFEKDEVKLNNIFTQLFGYTPEQFARQTKDNIERKGIAVDIERTRSKLMERYYRALQDELDIDKVLDQIDEYNDKYPMYPITPSQLSGSAKRREKEHAEAERGLVLQKRMRPALMPD